MKRSVFAALSASLLLLSVAPPSLAQSANVKVVVSGVRDAKGHVIVWLWSGPDGFAKDNRKAYKRIVLDASAAVDGKVTAELSAPPGDYAATSLHDANSNDKMDMNFLGIPSEGFGVSNNVMVMGPPAFDDTKFTVTSAPTTIPIKLRYF